MSFSEVPLCALIGGGPRGVSVLERLTANAPELMASNGFVVHLIDDTEPGAGRVWRTDQARELCMNTLAGAVTAFTDESVHMAGPVISGPTLYEWGVLALHGKYSSPATKDIVSTIPDDRKDRFTGTALRHGLVSRYREELRDLAPQSHPSRALYGEYLRWCLDSAIDHLPPTIQLVIHRARAVGITPSRERNVVTVDDGATILADTVVVSAGWLPRTPTVHERDLADALREYPELAWVRPGSPIDQDVLSIPDRAEVIVRGLGMGFFDALALVTIERGGHFVPEQSSRSGLRYVPSGREPTLFVTSHHGLPYRSKSMYGALPPAPQQRYLRSVNWGEMSRPIDFDRDVWPLVVKDAFVNYYTTLQRTTPTAFNTSLTAVLAAIDSSAGAPDEIVAIIEQSVAELIPDPEHRFSLSTEMEPVSETFDSAASFNAWVADYVAADLNEAALGRDSALKAGLWSISVARRPASTIGTFGGFDAESRIGGFRTLQSFGGMVGSGPPAFRSQQLLALVEAGLVRFIGPTGSVTVREGRFRASSPWVADAEASGDVLWDAWMHSHDVSATADPLILSLLRDERVREFRVSARAGGKVATGGIDIDHASGRVIHRDGTVDHSVHMAGIPIDEVLHDAIISPMPGANATMLQETDRIARSALGALSATRSAAVPA